MFKKYIRKKLVQSKKIDKKLEDIECKIDALTVFMIDSFNYKNKYNREHKKYKELEKESKLIIEELTIELQKYEKKKKVKVNGNSKKSKKTT